MTDTLTTAEKAALLADGGQVNPNNMTVTADPPGIVEILTGDGGAFVFGRTAGVVTVTVTEGTRSGSDEITVTDEPIVVTLGPVERQ